MKIINGLLLGLLLAAAGRGVAAQELPPGALDGGAGDLPPSVELGDDSYGSSTGDGGDLGGSLEPIPESISTGEVQGEFEGSILGEPMNLLESCNPSYFESSGTWLKRGFWYTEVDFLLLNRGWDRKGLVLASEETTSQTNPISLFQPYIVSNVLQIGGERPGAEGVGRVKLGRFLFRDSSNRDHLVEGAWYGGGDWKQAVSLEASTTAGLQVSNFIDRVNISFDDARSMNFAYDSQFNSGELNYLVKQRMQRDQVQLQPNGTWVRAANPTKTYSYLAGLRYVNLRESLDWNAFEIPIAANLDEGGTYNVETENNMFGAQLGGSFGYETARWSITASVKGGALWNRQDLHSRFQVGETTILNSGVTDSDQDDLSFVGETQLIGRWHLRPNLSLRAGLELLFIDSVALAPHQVNFIPGGYSAIASGGDSVMMGSSVGVESYW